METIKTKRYEACFELYLRFGGKNLSRIEREMRAHGFTDFNRRILYGRKENGVEKPGWIEKYEWRRYLSSPPYEGGVADASADGVVLSDAARGRLEVNGSS